MIILTLIKLLHLISKNLSMDVYMFIHLDLRLFIRV